MIRAIFLDRDGTLNFNAVRDGRPHGPDRIEDFILIPNVAEAVEELRRAGYMIVVATNQPNVARNQQTMESVDEMHALLRASVPIDDIRVCYHLDSDNCPCRKPKPGLLLGAAQEHGIDLAQSWMIGDRWRDVAAGQAAGCRTVFIDYEYAEPRPSRPDIVVRSLAEAVPILLRLSA